MFLNHTRKGTAPRCSATATFFSELKGQCESGMRCTNFKDTLQSSGFRVTGLSLKAALWFNLCRYSVVAVSVLSLLVTFRRTGLVEFYSWRHYSIWIPHKINQIIQKVEGNLKPPTWLICISIMCLSFGCFAILATSFERLKEILRML